MSSFLTPRNVFVAALLMLLALVPVYCAYAGNTFLMSFFTRVLIFAMAAVSLNLLMGFGGMVSSFIVDIDDRSSFNRLFTLDAISFLVFLAFILRQ